MLNFFGFMKFLSLVSNVFRKTWCFVKIVSAKTCAEGQTSYQCQQLTFPDFEPAGARCIFCGKKLAGASGSSLGIQGIY